MLQSSDVNLPKIFSHKQVAVTSLFVGPLMAAFLLTRNLKTLNRSNEIFKIWLWGIGFFVGLILLAVILMQIRGGFGIGRSIIHGFSYFMASFKWIQLFDKDEKKPLEFVTESNLKLVYFNIIGFFLMEWVIQSLKKGQIIFFNF